VITCPLLARLQGEKSSLPLSQFSIFIIAGDSDAFSDLDHMIASASAFIGGRWLRSQLDCALWPSPRLSQ